MTERKSKLSKTVQILMDNKIKFNWLTRGGKTGKLETLEWIIKGGNEIRLESDPELGIAMRLDGRVIFASGTEGVLKAVLNQYPSLTTK